MDESRRRIIRIILTIKINLMMLITVSYLFWKCLFFPGSDLSKKVINRSLNGVSNTQGKPINITVMVQSFLILIEKITQFCIYHSITQGPASKKKLSVFLKCANHYSGKRKNHKNNKGDKASNFAEITPHECRKNKQHHTVIAGKAIS